MLDIQSIKKDPVEVTTLEGLNAKIRTARYSISVEGLTAKRIWGSWR